MEDFVIQRIPVSRDEVRVNTGPVAFAGDWPGFFFRGDELPASYLRFAAECLRGKHKKSTRLAMAEGLERMARQMDASVVGQEWKTL